MNGQQTFLSRNLTVRGIMTYHGMLLFYTLLLLWSLLELKTLDTRNSRRGSLDQQLKEAQYNDAPGEVRRA